MKKILFSLLLVSCCLHADTHIDDAISLYQEGKLDDAERAFLHLSVQHPNQSAYHRGLIAVRQKNFATAYEHFLQLDTKALSTDERKTLVTALKYLFEYGGLTEIQKKSLAQHLKSSKHATKLWDFQFKLYTEYLDGIARDELKNLNVPPEREGRFRARATGKVGYSHKLSAKDLLKFDYQVMQIQYEPARTDLNVMTHQVGANWMRPINQRLSISQEYRYKLFLFGESMKIFLHSHQLESAVIYKFSANQLLRTALKIKKQNYRANDFDGEEYVLSSYFLQKWPTADLTMTLGYQFQSNHAEKKRFSYDQHMLMLGLKKTLIRDSSIRLNASYTHSGFGGRDIIETTKTRSDNKLSATLKYIYPYKAVDFEVFANYTRRKSSLVRHQYNSRMYGVGVVYKF